MRTSKPPCPPLTGRPNVVMIVLDDLGFADLGCYASSIATPNIDQLAQQGLRYNNFHVTAICSATRACLLTGRNHHAVGMGLLAGISTGFPGYTTRIPESAGSLPRLLRDGGYSTFAVGKCIYRLRKTARLRALLTGGHWAWASSAITASLVA